jgi:hypothetical protein
MLGVVPRDAIDMLAGAHWGTDCTVRADGSRCCNSRAAAATEPTGALARAQPC